MEYSHRYPAYPNSGVEMAIEAHIDIHRQAYNYALYEYNNVDAANIGSAYKHHDRLTGWKDEFPVFSEVNSKALQRTVTRLYQNESSLDELEANGNDVGELKWKSPGEFQSMTYSQSGFELKNTSGRTATLWLSKIGDIPIRYHRDIPDEAAIKEVTIKKETTGDWFVSFSPENGMEPDKPELDEITPDNSIGVDLGIINYIHTSDGLSVGSLNLESEYERLRTAQRTLSRRKKGSKNWETARKRVAKVKRRIKNTVRDFQDKLTTWLVTEYEAVFVENLDVKEMLEQSHNARNKQDAAWRQFLTLLKYKADRYGCHVVEVEPEGTTKECASCGVGTAKPIWVREHSCPSCGFETDRDANAAANILQRGFGELGLGWPEDTPVETVTATDTAQFESVSASHVIESGSPTLNKAFVAA